MDGYNSYTCKCLPNYEGPTCESDVNECQEFVGTIHGCQNGATCMNNVGSYSCQCPPDWYGVHCTERHDDCTSASTQALCSHGTCINQARVSPGQPRFTCICDQGWTTDNRSPACDVDIDECQSGPSACSRTPLVQCINIPGSFLCGPCPAGYTGNGFTCTDVDECLVSNGGCSLSPMVQCINTLGSRQCGPCPAGYQGDGIRCTFFGLCSMNNGGCHPLATCMENSAISSTYRECRCPPGYFGAGFGINGCIPQSGVTGGPTGALTPAPFNPCVVNPCIRGTCVATGPYAFRCNCPIGYAGSHCELDSDECGSSPCRNGGTCVDQPNGYVCHCSPHHTGTNCEQETDVCGGYLYEPNGTVHYPSNPSLTYQNDRSCAWIIITDYGKVLNVTFPEFSMEHSENCEFDFLQVNDGNSAGSHVVGRYCGISPPKGGSIISTHNSIYLWFHSDSSVSNDGFQFVWETIEPICGGDLPEANHGIVTSPGYPGQYPMDRDCVWTIRVPLGKRIQISFATLQMEHHDSCSFDFLEIRDGLLETDPVLGSYCGTETTPPQPMQSSGSFARIYFHSDESRTDLGFHITYSSVPSVHGCGGLLTTESGAFSSPDHPNPYSHNLECDWQIRVAPNERIRLSFVTFDIEAHDICRFDYVTVYDGSDEAAPLIGRHCGRTLPPFHLSSGNTLFVKFHTDNSVARDGFRAQYTVVCGGTFTEPQGLVHSPYYPNPYPAERECIYVILQDPGKAIELRFNAFDIEGSYNCRFDYLRIRDGDSETSPTMDKLCGTVLPAPILSTYNALWLQFKSDGSMQNAGFLANYSTIDIACGGILTDISGVITSPNHPDEYLHNVTCRWIIKPPDGYVVRLTFTTFAVEHHSNCAYDYVAVYDNTTTENESKLTRRYCGNDLPPVLTSLENLMLIVFHSDTSVARDGFAIHYVALDASAFCGGEYFSTVGVIRSPNFPNGYTHSKRCTWKIEVPTGQQVLLNITRFELESHRDCTYDYVEIRNGGYGTSPLVGRYCGTMAPHIIPSHGNQIWVQFVSDRSMSAPGFEIFWDGATTGCGGELTSSQGSIISPNYPESCSSNLDCTWRIVVSRGNKVRIMFTDLDLPTSENCIYGLEIYNGRSSLSPLMKRVCGNSIPDALISDTNEVFIRYRCNGWRSTKRGFHLAYETVCRVQLNGRRGVIETPNFPNSYPHERNCSWRIQGPSGNKINMSFAMLKMEEAPDCRYDYIEVFSNQNRTSIGKFCAAHQVPKRLSSTTNVAAVTFVSDSSYANNGFSMEWVASGCGGEFRKPSGVFSSPNYPQQYPPLTTCDWEIAAEPGQNIELTVQEYDMEGSFNCIYDSLKIYGGPTARAPLLTSLCHRQPSPVIITSSGNHLYARFKTDSSRSGRGFNASYVIKSDGCGGIFTLNKGTIHSRNFPDHYSVRDDCSWRVTVKKGHAIHFLFKNFDIQPGTNCSAVYVAVYDGPDEFSPLLVQHCGSHLPTNNPFVSSNNQLFIQMKAHESISATGFQAEYKMTCGAVLYADEPGDISIMSQAFASVLPSNCSWIIRARNLEDRVTLMFTFLEILRSPLNCSHHLIEIYDGEQSDSPLLMGICSPDIPAAITSRGSSLRVVSQNRFNNLRFRAVYYEASAGCGGTFESLSGTFVSPDYPDSYPTDSECVWTIKTAPGHRAILSFSVFDLEQSDYCNDDYVEIRENNEGGPLIGRFCDQTPPENLTASHQLWIKFRSNGQGVGQGFVASYSLLYHSSLSGTSGQIANPLYPNAYRGFGTYEWTVTVPLGMFVQLSFVELDLLHYEFSKVCVASLTFYDGTDVTGTELLNYCGAILQNPVVSHGNQMHILFNSRHALSSSGSTFLLKWNATVDRSVPVTEVTRPSTSSSDCDAIINIDGENNHVLQSPGFPFGYPPDKRCEWLITTPLGTRVSFYISSMNLVGPRFYVCFSDHIEVFSGTTIPGEWINLGRYCDRSHVNEVITSGTNNMKIVFVSNYAYNRTGFSGTVHAVCGGNMTVPSGSIQTPHYPNNYEENAVCDWLISVRPGRTISLQFEGFELEGTMPTCRNDYILFRNGLSNESPLLGSGKYCGSSIPNLPDTTSNHLFVRFVSNPSFTWKGFKLIFNEISLECGGLKMLSQSVTSARIETPNFPGPFPIQTECEWTIIVPSQSRVRLDFEDHFDIPFEQECVNDYLVVHDGGTIHSPVLGQFCGHDLPSSLQASGNTMFVRFFSVDTHPSTGFRAAARIAACGGTISADSGVITSPNYPHGYTIGLDCEWIVRAAVGHFLILTVVDIQTSVSDWNNQNCSASDVLQIRDFNSTGLLLGEFCGEANPSSVSTADHVAYLRFTSKRNSPMMRGFRVTFNISAEVECGGELTTPSGIITSPNFPGFYPSHRLCIWQIHAPFGRRVRLTFTHFNLEGKKDHSCPDWLAAFNVMDYERDFSLLPPFYICGSTLPVVITSGSNFMLIKFFTNEQTSASGFRAVYDTDLEYECGGDLELPTGIVTSPGFELGNYTHNLDCRWYLNAPQPNATFVIKVNHFTIESAVHHGLCRYDRLEIFSGLDVASAFSFASYCGNITDVFVVAVPFSQLILRFKTDTSVVYTGFNLSYSMSDCGGELTEAGVITSPGYSSTYGNDIACAWVVKFQDGQQVQMTFDDFALENSNDCTADYLLVRNGMSNNSPVIGKYCGNEKPREIKSHRHNVLIEFHTNSASVDRGFRITVVPVSSGCGGVLSGKEGQIQSVGYPSKYPANVECEWILEGETSYYFNLTFIGRFDLEMSPNCDRDFLEGFHFIDGNWVSLGRRCGRDVPRPYFTKTPKFRLLFRTNEAVDGDGFRANWTETCGGFFTESAGVITSPNYPNSYPLGVECVYVIASDPSHYVVLEFDDDFQIEETPPECLYDAVRIYSGNNTDGTLLSESCGTTPPARIALLGAITIQFKSDSSVTRKGFHARYRVSECGGIFNRSSETSAFGVLSSPTHPERYHANMNCTWIIQVQPNRVVDYQFQKLDLEQGMRDCSFDYVALYDGNDTARPLLGRFCGSNMPDPIRTTGSFLTVQFVTDDIIEHTGFSGVYRETFGELQGCGGVLNTSFGTVQSLDFDHDGKYERGLECQWTIIGASFKVLRLSFHTFDVEKPTDKDDCSLDFLEVRDGPSSDSPLIERMCGTAMPNTVLASTNQLWLKFVSDEVEERAGFQATFESTDPLCGGVFNVTNIPQTIQSPNYPENYPINVRCHWMLLNPDQQRGIEIHFTQFILEKSYRCTKDSVFIQDVNAYHNHVYCGLSISRYYYPSSRNAVKIYFTSDSSVVAKGFQLNYQLASCNRTYNDPYGLINGQLMYQSTTSEMTCIFQIAVPENRTITISFENFYINTIGGSCDEANLQIRDGSTETAPLLATLCGTDNPTPISSSGNYLWLKIHAAVGSYHDFDLLYYSTTEGKGCGGEIVASSGRFASPNYPGNYSRDAVCRWTVTVPSNKIAGIYFNQLNIHTSENCTGNFVQIFDSKVESDSHLLNTFCGNEIPDHLATTGNEFLVKYVTNTENSGLGFHIGFYSLSNSEPETRVNVLRGRL